MTQQVLHARVSFPSTGTFVDSSSNSFTFEATGSDTSLTISDVDEVLTNFYNNTPTGGARAPAAYLSNKLSRASNVCSITYYDVTAHLDGSTPGSPIHITPWTLGASANPGDLAGQLAVGCGYRGPYGTDLEHGATGAVPTPDRAVDEGAPSTHSGVFRPRARDRARIYFGPLCRAALDDGGSDTPSSFLLDDLKRALNTLCDTQVTGAHDQFNLVVWSRRNAGVLAVNNGFRYIDEAFCTQRRRSDTSAARVHAWVANT